MTTYFSFVVATGAGQWTLDSSLGAGDVEKGLPSRRLVGAATSRVLK